MIYRSIYLVVASLLITACGGSNSPSSAQNTAPPSAGSSDYRAEIRRGEHGMVHIKASDYAGIGYGYSYAFAEDNICTIVW